MKSADAKADPKDQRIPVMMSVADVRAIDEWMFANRVRSRSEAIRQLCRATLDTTPGQGRQGGGDA